MLEASKSGLKRHVTKGCGITSFPGDAQVFLCSFVPTSEMHLSWDGATWARLTRKDNPFLKVESRHGGERGLSPDLTLNANMTHTNGQLGPCRALSLRMCLLLTAGWAAPLSMLLLAPQRPRAVRVPLLDKTGEGLAGLCTAVHLSLPPCSWGSQFKFSDCIAEPRGHGKLSPNSSQIKARVWVGHNCSPVLWLY